MVEMVLKVREIFSYLLFFKKIFKHYLCLYVSGKLKETLLRLIDFLVLSKTITSTGVHSYIKCHNFSSQCRKRTAGIYCQTWWIHGFHNECGTCCSVPPKSGTVQLWRFRRSPEVFAPKTSQFNVSLCPDLVSPFSDVLFPRAVPYKPSAVNLQLRICLSGKSI